MILYLVSKKIQEESRIGVVEVAETIIYGVFSSNSRALNIASKYGADVSEFYLDKETRSIVQKWINPGYAD